MPPDPPLAPADREAAEIATLVRRAALTVLPAAWTHLPDGTPAHVAIGREAARLWREANRRRTNELDRDDDEQSNTNEPRRRGRPLAEWSSARIADVRQPRSRTHKNP